MKKKLVSIILIVALSGWAGYQLHVAQAAINHPRKVVQRYIQGVLEPVDLIEQADALLQCYKVRFVDKNPDLTSTNITQAQINALAIWINDVHAVATSAVVTTLKNKDQPSVRAGTCE